MMITIDSPVFMFFVKGDLKEKLKNWLYTHVTSYEQTIDVTFCVVKSVYFNREQRRSSEKKLEKTLNKIGVKPIGLKYYLSGLDIKEYWKDNNLLN